jgi:SAM-dependent methyltransferase
VTKRPSSIPRCPACGADSFDAIYEAADVPVHLVRLIATSGEARAAARGEIGLVLCRACGLIWNRKFDAAKLTYDAAYESTQACSPVFRRFHADLADRIVRDCALRGKHVVELGCGHGEFLEQLLAAGAARATGFDPAAAPRREGRLTVHGSEFDPGAVPADVAFVCCKMTLEHIAEPRRLLEGIAGTMTGEQSVTVFFMVPDATRILAEGAFWDVYYEHVLYFRPSSLARTFRNAGFEVLALDGEYDGQYCTIAAQPTVADTAVEAPSREELDEARGFRDRAAAQGAYWIGRLTDAAGPTVIWGGGSKAVAFLTALGDRIAVDGVVDINPVRQGTFLPVAGHEILAPEDLPRVGPRRVVVMNPVYRGEIAAMLGRMGLDPEVLVVGVDGPGEG